MNSTSCMMSSIYKGMTHVAHVDRNPRSMPKQGAYWGSYVTNHVTNFGAPPLACAFNSTRIASSKANLVPINVHRNWRFYRTVKLAH